MKTVIATLLICIILGSIVILGYAIFLNADGIIEAFLSFPLPYLFWFILGIVVGGVFAPLVYKRIKRFTTSKSRSSETDLE